VEARASIRGRRSLVALTGVALLVVACAAPGGAASVAPAGPTGSAGSAPAAPAAAGVAVGVMSDPTLGGILVGEGGKTLYVFTKDAGGKSVCNDDCATAWPPLLAPDGTAPTPGEGVTGVLGTIIRDDGTTQVTIGGAPLYYFAADARAGDVNGQGVNDVWFVVGPSGAIVKAAGAAGASPTAADDDYTRGGGSPTGAPAAGAASATIADFDFSPPTTTVPVGTTVTWTNSGDAPHTVTADDGSFDSGSLANGGTFSQVFATAGTFAYHCAIHSQMVGSVVVTP
jgi:predicted lipoprotein with Yx(FWY)xxD motif/plastocyanin